MNFKIKGDMLWISLVVQSTLEILGKLVESISHPWEGAKLGMVRKK